MVNRAATFVFYLGERFFGTVTAFVPGEQAAAYDHLGLPVLSVNSRNWNRCCAPGSRPPAAARVPLPGLVGQAGYNGGPNGKPDADLSSLEFWTAVLQIVAIDIVLSGDNAVVIAPGLPQPGAATTQAVSIFRVSPAPSFFARASYGLRRPGL